MACKGKIHNASSSPCLFQQCSAVKVVSKTLSLHSLATFRNDVVLYSLDDSKELKGNGEEDRDHFLLQLFLCVSTKDEFV